jgi:hypothetical protein
MRLVLKWPLSTALAGLSITSIVMAGPSDSQWIATPQVSAELAAAGLELMSSSIAPGNDGTFLLVTFWRDQHQIEFAGEVLSRRVFRCFDETQVGQNRARFCEVAWTND